MFCATFYSYKGGVGRTLALANVAALLMLRDKKVLVVDFDLEAPGLNSIDLFRSSEDNPGLVDFVTDYVQSGTVPSAADFIYECKIEHGETSQKSYQIDVMAAGQENGDYSSRLSKIDWARLYDEKEGFLLLEDLRSQWKKLGYDYVLIDSRTGHTDVGGICTRQLPDAVVNIFFPNEQNLSGLTKVVEETRDYGARPYDIDMLFVASRVPRLDDEHDLLKKWLKKFEKALDYEKDDLTLIEHYDSMSLLDQELFVLTRKKSGLSKQYRQLEQAVARLNPEDADGAMSYLRKVRRRHLLSQFSPDQFDLSEDRAMSRRLEKIGDNHKGDYLVQYLLAQTYFTQRDFVKASTAVDLGLAADLETKTHSEDLPLANGRLHQLRIQLANEFGDDYGAALESARVLLDNQNSDGEMILEALTVLAAHDPNNIPEPKSLEALSSTSPSQLTEIAEKLSQAPNTVNLAGSIVELALSNKNREWLTSYTAINIQLILISARKFDLALEIYQPIKNDEFSEMIFLFNTAIAAWGQKGSPDREWLTKFLEIAEDQYSEGRTANFYQCMALAYAAMGDFTGVEKNVEVAIAKIKEARTRREFSCWTYQNVPLSEFVTHTLSIETFARSGGPPPPWSMNQ